MEPVDLSGARIKGVLSLNGSHFHSADNEPAISMQSATIGQGLRCRDALHCHGDIELSFAEIGGSVEFYDAKIQGRLGGISLEEAEVRGSLNLVRTTVEGCVDLSAAHIHRRFFVFKCRVLGPKGNLNLHSTIVDGPIGVVSSRITKGINRAEI